MASVMSQVLQSPALNGLLSGVSEQTGVGSPDALRNMLQQFTQSPQMRNVVNQIAQQVDSQDVGSMFTGMGGQGGGLDLSRMFQQMMPIVSRALGATGSTPHQPLSVVEPQSLSQYGQRSPDGYVNSNQNLQVCMGYSYLQCWHQSSNLILLAWEILVTYFLNFCVMCRAFACEVI